jgi:hypothetical protein
VRCACVRCCVELSGFFQFFARYCVNSPGYKNFNILYVLYVDLRRMLYDRMVQNQKVEFTVQQIDEKNGFQIL